MAEGKKLLTREGLKKYEDELDELKFVKRKEISQKIKEAREQGDLSENSEYDEARNAQAVNEAKILELEFLLEHAKVVDESEIDASVANIGSKVLVFDVDEDEEVEYSIVGSNQADPLQNRVSDVSPIGQALIGAHIGEKVTVHAPGGEYTLEVRALSRE